MHRLAGPVFVGGVLGVSTAGSVVRGQCHLQEIEKLVPGDGGVQHWFGCAVSFDGETALIGARHDDDNGHLAGSVYVYETVGGEWSSVQKLLASDGTDDDSFGYSVSLDADTALVGSPLHSVAAPASGAVYVFERDGDWAETAMLVASDGAEGDYFGSAVWLSGDTALLGAYGADGVAGVAYIFERVGGVWTGTAKLTAADRAPGDGFGARAWLDGDVAVVGAPWDDDLGADSGSVYVFERVGGVWMQTAKLTASDGATNAYFGSAVHASGDTLLVGAGGDDQGRGAVYAVDRVGGVWTESAKLTTSGAGLDDWFGTSVFVEGDRALIGSYLDNELGELAGAAYVFERSSGGWSQRSKLTASDADQGAVGYALAFSGDTAVVGAPYDSPHGFRSGSSYVFDLSCECAADFNGDFALDTRDVLSFLGAWAAGDMSADWDGSGSVDTADFTAYLNEWAAGC